MTKRVQRFGLVSATLAVTVGLARELIMDLTNGTITLHDGVTSGGIPMARKDLGNVAVATGATNGIMSAADKTKVDGIASGATNTPLSSSTPSAGVTAGVIGVGSTAARADHQHPTTLVNHQIAISDAVGSLKGLTPGAPGTVLTSNGASADASFQAVNAHGGTNVISTSTLVTNGVNPASTTGWTAQNATVTIVSSAFHVAATNSNGDQSQALACTIGDTYTVNLDVTVIPGGTAFYGIGTALHLTDVVNGSRGTTGTGISLTFTATQATHYITYGQVTNGQSADFNNIKVWLTTHLLTNADSTLQEAAPSLGPLTIKLGDATTYTTLGFAIYLMSCSQAATYPIHYRDNGANYLWSLAPGQDSIISLVNNGSANGTWRRKSSAELGGLCGTFSQWKSGAAQSFSDICALDSTHVLVVYGTSGDATAKVQAFSLNADGTISASGNVLTITPAGGGATIGSNIKVIKLSATQVIIVLSDSTNAQINVVAVNISGVTTSLPVATPQTITNGTSTSPVAGAAFSATHFFVVFKNPSDGFWHSTDLTIVTGTGVITVGTNTASTAATVSYTTSAPAACVVGSTGFWTISGNGILEFTAPATAASGIALGIDGFISGQVIVTTVLEPISTTGFLAANDTPSLQASVILVTGVGGTLNTVGIIPLNPATGGACTIVRIKKISANRAAVYYTASAMSFVQIVSFNEATGALKLEGQPQFLYQVTANVTTANLGSMDLLANGKLIISACQVQGATTNSFAQVEVPQ